MYSSSKSSGAVTRAKETDNLNGSRFNGACKYSENLNPNLPRAGSKSNSTLIKFWDRTKKSNSGNRNGSTVDTPLVEKKFRGRNFAKMKMKSCSEELHFSKETVVCSKYKKSGNGNLRACRDDSFNRDIVAGLEEIERRCDLSQISGENDNCTDKNKVNYGIDLNRSRDRTLEEARESVPEPGSGRVMHLVKAFEKLLSFYKLRDSEEKVQEVEYSLQQPEMQDCSFCPSEFFVSLESSGLDSRGSCSLDSRQESILTQTSAGSRRSGLSSPESAEIFYRRNWRRRRTRTTSPKPFKLRTEQRGKIKEEEFMKKLQQMMEEEAKLRMPIALGLPWTTEEPECVVKPPVKENTRPIDLVLHTDARAVERALFDHQVTKKVSLLEHYRMEIEKRQKLDDEEAIRRLRRELVPKALPMPYFDRPFVPKRDTKHPTIPREPKFQIPINKKKKKKSLIFLDDFSLH